MNLSDQLDYARQQGAADVELLRRQHVVVVGIDSASTFVKTLARMGIGKITAIDPDVVEFRNVTSQGYTFEEARQQRPKVEALRDECLAINPNLRFEGLQEDFVLLPDGQVRAILADATLLIMTTDHHPAQARGNLAGLVCDVPVLFGSLYRQGRAGEIILQYPGLTKACYRCITRDRYQYVARQRTSGTGHGAGSLPFAPQLVDSILGFLAIGVLHRRHGATDNPYAAWIDRVANRGFIQTRMGAPPSYVGYGDTPPLLQEIERNPFLVVLLDEIEKAHPDILKTLMALIDTGELSSPAGGDGTIVGDFRRCVLVFTSNARLPGLERDGNADVDQASVAFQLRARNELVRQHLPPEIAGRIQTFLLFHELSAEQLLPIVADKIQRCEADYGVLVSRISPLLLTELAQQAISSSFGVRIVEMVVERRIAAGLVELLREHPPLEKVEITLVDGQVVVLPDRTEAERPDSNPA